MSNKLQYCKDIYASIPWNLSKYEDGCGSKRYSIIWYAEHGFATAVIRHDALVCSTPTLSVLFPDDKNCTILFVLFQKQL